MAITATVFCFFVLSMVGVFSLLAIYVPCIVSVEQLADYALLDPINGVIKGKAYKAQIGGNWHGTLTYRWKIDGEEIVGSNASVFIVPTRNNKPGMLPMYEVSVIVEEFMPSGRRIESAAVKIIED